MSSNDIDHPMNKCVATVALCIEGWTLADVQSIFALMASIFSAILGLIYLGEWAYKRLVLKRRPGETNLAPLSKE